MEFSFRNWAFAEQIVDGVVQVEGIGETNGTIGVAVVLANAVLFKVRLNLDAGCNHRAWLF